MSDPPNLALRLEKLVVPGAGDPDEGDDAPDPPDDGLWPPPLEDNFGATKACATAGMFVVGMDPSPVSMDRTPAPPPNPYPLGPNSFP